MNSGWEKTKCNDICVRVSFEYLFLVSQRLSIYILWHIYMYDISINGSKENQTKEDFVRGKKLLVLVHTTLKPLLLCL